MGNSLPQKERSYTGCQVSQDGRHGKLGIASGRANGRGKIVDEIIVPDVSMRGRSLLIEGESDRQIAAYTDWNTTYRGRSSGGQDAADAFRYRGLFRYAEHFHLAGQAKRLKQRC